MSKQLEERLNECLDALSSGQRTLEECLSMYPEDAAQLEPMLRAALMLKGAYSAQPRPEFASSARERFLRMTPSRLEKSLSFEPRPSFVMAARQRFLAAARRMMAEERKPRRWEPAFRVAQFASAAAVVFVMGFGGFAVTTSANALPGDWQYPVKRKVEDVRYTLTLSDGGRKQLDIEYTQERLSEVQKLADEGRSISEGTLKDLADQTDSLVTRLDDQQLSPQEAQKVEALATKQQIVLSDVEPLVEPKASDELLQAKSVSKTALVLASSFIAAHEDSEEEETPEPTASPTEATAAETPTPESTQEPGPTETIEPTPAPTEPAVTPEPGTIVVLPLEDEDAAGITWSLIMIDGFSVHLPAESSGWHFMGLTMGPDNTADAPFMLRVTNADASAIIIVNPRNGDTYWEQYLEDGLFHELKAREADGETVRQATEAELTAFSEANAQVVLHVIESIEIQAPTPTPEPTPTGTPTPEGILPSSAVTPLP